MTVLGGDDTTHTYYVKARSRRDAERYAREWVATTEWSASLVDVSPVDEPRSLLTVAATTLVVSGFAITAAMVIGLSLEGAL